MRSSNRRDNKILSEHYTTVYHQKTIDESIDHLEHNLKLCVEQAKIDEGLAGLATRTKDRMSGALAGAGAALKNIPQAVKGVATSQANLQDPRAAANQKKIQNVLNRFNRDITALVPDLKQQQPELSVAIDQLNQAAQQQPAPTAGTPPEAAGTPPQAAPADGGSPEVAPADGGSPEAAPVRRQKNKEGILSRIVKAPGRALAAAEKKAKDLEAKTAAGGVETLLPGYTDPNDKVKKDKNPSTPQAAPVASTPPQAAPVADTPPAEAPAEAPAAEAPELDTDTQAELDGLSDEDLAELQGRDAPVGGEPAAEPSAEPVDPTAARTGIDAAYDDQKGGENYNTQTGEKRGAQTGNVLNKYAADLKAAQQSGDKKTMNIVAKDILAYATSTQHQGGQADTVKRGAKELLKRLGMPQANSQQLNECINRLLNSMTVLIREQKYLKHEKSNILGGCGFMSNRWGNFS